MTSFRLLHRRGTALDLFAEDPDYAGVPTVVDVRVTQPALVLGSTQPLVAALAPDPPIDVVRRRSGGGAVLVEPGDVAWVDVFLPAGHPLWQDDVGRAFWWLGDAWAAALRALGVAGRIEVHKGPLITTPWSPLVCFAGLGPGEVTADGSKAVGMAQRRTRDGALFQCAVPLAWRPERLLALFERGLASWDHSLTQSEQPLEPTEQPLAQLEHLLAQSEQPLGQSEQSLTQLEQPLESLEQSLTQSERSLPRSERALAQSEQALTQSDRSLAQSDRSLAQSDRSLAQSEHPLAQSEQALTHLDRPLTWSEQALAQSEWAVARWGPGAPPAGWVGERWERVLQGLADGVFSVGPLTADDCVAALLEALA